MNTNIHDQFIGVVTNNKAFEREFILGSLLINSTESNDSISFVSGLDNEQISYLESYIKYFGYKIDGIDSWNDLYTKVNEKIRQINEELQRLRRKEWNAWYNKLLRNLKQLGLWIMIIPFLFLLIITDLLLYIPVAIVVKFSRVFGKRDDASNTNIHNYNIANTINYNENAHSNKSDQIVNLSINGQNGAEKVKLTDSTKSGLAEKLAHYILLSNFNKFNSKIITILHNLGVRVKNIPYLNDNIKYGIVVFISYAIILYLASNVTVKFTASALLIMFAIPLTYKACSNNDLHNEPIKEETSTSLIPDNLSIPPTIDSINIEKENVPAKTTNDESTEKQLSPIFAYKDYYNQIQEAFGDSNSCLPLAEMGTKQIEFIQIQDMIDHTKQNYYIHKPDGFYYLHVVVYRTIQQAAFQVHYINLNTEFDDNDIKILPVESDKGDTLYAVTISSHKGIEVNDLCGFKDDWFLYCNEREKEKLKNEIGVYYNG